MSKKYNYNYKTSKRRGNNGLLALVVILVVLAAIILTVILNWGKITDKIYDFMGMEPATSTTETSGDQGTASSTTSASSSSSIETTSTSASTEELKWYQKEPVYTRNPVNVEPLVNDLKNFIFEFSGIYGVSFLDLTSGATFGINDIDYYEAASTIKIPLSLFIYNKVATEDLNLNERMTYEEQDHEGGTGYIINHGKVGDEYTLRLLVNYAIIYSDNIATNMLLRKFGRDNLKQFMRELGGEIVDDIDNVSCPRDMTLYLKQLTLFEQEYPDLGREIISYLRKVHMFTGGYVNTPEADLRLIRYLPPEIQRDVAHKTGNSTGAWHDVGIIYADNPYILSVMTYGVLYDEVNDVIANISKKVFEYMENLKSY